MREQVVEFLKPDRNKIIAALLFPYLIFLFGASLYGVVYLKDIPMDIPFSEYIRIDLSFIFTALLKSVGFYPFVCSLFVIVRLYRRGGFREIHGDKHMLSLIILGILIFNPISFTFLLAISNLFLFSLKSPPIPMVEVVEISPDTPLKDLEVGDKIYKITIVKLGEEYREVRNNITYINPNVTDKKIFVIQNSSDFYQAMEEAKEWDSIHIRTLRIIFSKKIPENITDWGVKVRDIEYKQWL